MAYLTNGRSGAAAAKPPRTAGMAQRPSVLPSLSCGIGRRRKEGSQALSPASHIPLSFLLIHSLTFCCLPSVHLARLHFCVPLSPGNTPVHTASASLHGHEPLVNCSHPSSPPLLPLPRTVPATSRHPSASATNSISLPHNAPERRRRPRCSLSAYGYVTLHHASRLHLNSCVCVADVSLH